MSAQRITDDEMREAARELLSAGALTCRALKARVGGDSGRVSRVMREVRAEQDDRMAASPEPADSPGAEADDMPAGLRADLGRLERSVLVRSRAPGTRSASELCRTSG